MNEDLGALDSAFDAIKTLLRMKDEQIDRLKKQNNQLFLQLRDQGVELVEIAGVNRKLALQTVEGAPEAKLKAARRKKDVVN